MQTSIQNQFGNFIVCEPQYTEILDMLHKGIDSQPAPQTPTQDQQGALPTIDLDQDIPFAPMNWRL